MATELQAAVITNLGTETTPSDNPGKRQRRPSVRLGDIGDTHRSSKPWNPNKSSKIRPLTNLTLLDYDNNSHRKSKRATSVTSSKRLRTNLRDEDEDEVGNTINTNNNNNNNNNNPDFAVFEYDDDINTNNNGQEEEEEEEEDEEEEDEEEGFRDFDPENQSPINSPMWHRRGSHGVRKWLVELGLLRYAPVFDIHEVDDEVLPFLTLEDLKDMGINAVGSRRKLFSAILNLRKSQ